MPASFIRLAAGALACALAWPASAQLLNEKNLSAAMAMTIAETALETCTKQGYHVSVHVLGRNGEVLVAVRGDGAPPHTMENSQRKAYTSRTFRIPSGEFVQRVKDNPTTVPCTSAASSQPKVPCRSRSVKRSSAQSACPGRPAAKRTRPAPRPASTRLPISSSDRSRSLDQQRGQLVLHAEHRVVAGVELEPLRLELLGRAALVRFAGVHRTTAPDHFRRPWLRREASAAAPDARRSQSAVTCSVREPRRASAGRDRRIAGFRILA